jgi:DNA-binding response OmpR family regulator
MGEARCVPHPGDKEIAGAGNVQIVRLRKKIESDPARPLHIRTERGAGYQFECRSRFLI